MIIAFCKQNFTAAWVRPTRNCRHIPIQPLASDLANDTAGQSGEPERGRNFPACVTTVRQRLSWYKDGVEFPWGEQPGRNTVLYSNNRSLVLLEVAHLKS